MKLCLTVKRDRALLDTVNDPLIAVHITNLISSFLSFIGSIHQFVVRAYVFYIGKQWAICRLFTVFTFTDGLSFPIKLCVISSKCFVLNDRNIAMKFGAPIYVSLRMNCNNLWSKFMLYLVVYILSFLIFIKEFTTCLYPIVCKASLRPWKSI